MDTPTTVPELRRLLDAKQTTWPSNYYIDARNALSDALTDATIAAMLTALEAAQNGCATCIEAMSPYYDSSLEACERICCCSHARTRAALAPLFPKEDDDE